MTKYLITGGAGFIGSHLVEELVKRGEEVIVIDNLSTGNLNNIKPFLDKIKFIEGSITNLELLKTEFVGVDYVLHQAAIPSVPRSVANPVLTNQANVEGTLNVFTAAKDCGVKKVVYASSSSIYGDSETLPKIETMQYNPLSPYASQKVMGEYYGKLFFKLYGLETVGLRYFNIFGPRQDPDSEYSAVIPKFIKLILNNRQPTIYGDGKTSRDFTFIQNVVQANLLACQASNVGGKVFNIACGDRFSLNDLAKKINFILGKEIPTLYGEFRVGDVKHSLADIGLAKQYLGYQVKVDFESGLRQTIDFLKKEMLELELIPAAELINNNNNNNNNNTSIDKSETNELNKSNKLSETLKQTKICVVGLGYVGLPLAVEFSKQFSVIGFDVNEKRIAELKNNLDNTNETGPEELENCSVNFTYDPIKIKECNFIIVCVPTPVDKVKKPDLNYVKGASEVVAQNLSAGSIIVYESTVFPGCTEEICVPIIEKFSGLKSGMDFKVGYSPERINPGDKEHSLTRVIKIVSGEDKESLEKIAEVYSRIVEAGVHQAPNIKTAEAAKVIENVQRDLNIALINELAIIFDKMGIKTKDVLAAAGTKWNWHKYTPGLVGGHCIGVDPYFLTYKAEELGYHPEVILAGRRINDNMHKFLAEKVIKKLNSTGKPIKGSKILIMGLTFKPDVKDHRNSRTKYLIKELQDYGVEVLAHDYLLENELVEKEFGVKNYLWEEIGQVDAIVLASAHKKFKELNWQEKMDIPIFIDLKEF